MVIAKKRVERRKPLLATAMEVYKASGLDDEAQYREAERLSAAGIIIIGRTLNERYYQIVQDEQ